MRGLWRTGSTGLAPGFGWGAGSGAGWARYENVDAVCSPRCVVSLRMATVGNTTVRIAVGSPDDQAVVASGTLFALRLPPGRRTWESSPCRRQRGQSSCSVRASFSCCRARRRSTGSASRRNLTRRYLFSVSLLDTEAMSYQPGQHANGKLSLFRPCETVAPGSTAGVTVGCHWQRPVSVPVG